jgi:predicted nucleic acid-binding Zn ribbon protein
VKKLISKSSFHLKGSGWYLTDYAKKNSPSSSESESPSASSSDTTSSSSDKD